MINTVFSIALQVYLASLAQLLVMLLIVVSLTEVKEVRDFQRQHNWIWALASGNIRALFKHNINGDKLQLPPLCFSSCGST